MSAAFDRRRIAAPESSHPPIYDPLPQDHQEQQQAEAGPSRRTERRDDEARSIFLKTGLISQANGSGYIEAGNVKIACSVYGPRPKPPPYSPLGTLNLEVKFAPFASDPRRAPLRDTEPAALSLLLTQLLLPALQLHLYPKSSVDVHLLVLEGDSVPSVLSAGLTVSSAAVADAGIGMNALAVGGVVSLSSDGVQHQSGSGSGVLVDPSKEEERASQACLTVGTLPALGRVTNLHLTGQVGVDQVLEMIDTALTASRETHTLLAQALLEGAEDRGIGAEAESGAPVAAAA